MVLVIVVIFRVIRVDEFVIGVCFRDEYDFIWKKGIGGLVWLRFCIKYSFRMRKDGIEISFR